MNYNVLKTELVAGHPDTGAYDLDDAIAADQLNAINRTRNRISMTGSEIINAIDKTEFNALSVAEEQLIWNLLHLSDLNPFGVEADLFTDVFGGGSTTIMALQALRVELISRAMELGLGIIREGTIQQARAM